MGAKTSKPYSSLRSPLNLFNLFLNFLLSGSHKITVLDFFSFSFTWEPMGAKTSKPYSSLKSLLNFS